MNMNFNFIHMIMWNTLASRWHQDATEYGCNCAFTSSNQIPSLMWE